MKWLDQLWVTPSSTANPELEQVFQYQWKTLPTLWLLGKTGAGKSSLIQALTGDSAVAIGNGFQPCTQTAQIYTYPQAKPLMRFLDTRGLAEADYDASADIEACQDRSHALLVLMKADDPEQHDVLKALKQVKKSGKIKQLLVVHTGILLVTDPLQRQQAIAFNQQQVESLMGEKLSSVAVDFVAQATEAGLTVLQQTLVDLLPIIAQLQYTHFYNNQEEQSFAAVRQEVLWYAGAAAASDALAGAGFAAIPALQGRMLYSLATQYGLKWDKSLIIEFITALGTGFGAYYLSRLGIQQLSKLMPEYDKTLQSATKVGLSFATTYAVGRVANKYLYHKYKGEKVAAWDLRALYRQALTTMLNNKVSASL